MRTSRKRSSSDIYHVIHRGVGRQIIFEDDKDCIVFIDALQAALEKQDIELLCWCLTSNHFHLLLKGELGNVSAAMRACCGNYAKRFNARHGRTGHLFQERFRSEPVQDDAYLLTVVRYIHQNPVAAGTSESCDVAWSSYRWYLRGEGPCPCSDSFVLEMFGGLAAFERAHGEPCVTDACLEETPRRRNTLPMSDDRAILVADEVIGSTAIETVKSWDKESRNEALRKLSKAGLSIRQIERLTGIGRNTVARAVK